MQELIEVLTTEGQLKENEGGGAVRPGAGWELRVIQGADVREGEQRVRARENER